MTDKPEQIKAAFAEARKILARTRNQERKETNQILQMIAETRVDALNKYVFPTMKDIARKICRLQIDQGVLIGRNPGEDNLPFAKLVEVRARIGMLPQKQIDSFGYISFITRANDKQNSFFAGFDQVEKIDDNFLPRMMTDGVDTIKFLQWIKSDHHEVLALADTDKPEQIKAALQLIEIRALDAAQVDTQGAVSLAAFRNAPRTKARSTSPSR